MERKNKRKLFFILIILIALIGLLLGAYLYFNGNIPGTYPHVFKTLSIKNYTHSTEEIDQICANLGKDAIYHDLIRLIQGTTNDEELVLKIKCGPPAHEEHTSPPEEEEITSAPEAEAEEEEAEAGSSTVNVHYFQGNQCPTGYTNIMTYEGCKQGLKYYKDNHDSYEDRDVIPPSLVPGDLSNVPKDSLYRYPSGCFTRRASGITFFINPTLEIPTQNVSLTEYALFCEKSN